MGQVAVIGGRNVGVISSTEPITFYINLWTVYGEVTDGVEFSTSSSYPRAAVSHA